MQLKYVGAKPIVSKHGVGFDQSKPDAYTFISAAMMLLDALESISADEDGVVDMREWSGREYSDKELSEKVAKYCNDFEALSAEKESETEKLIDDLVKKVKANETISADERRAWLGNIAMMRNYYMQYIANELAYRCLLGALAEKMIAGHISEILFPLYQNYGLVFSHLVPVLTDHRPPVDATITIEGKEDVPYGKFNTNRHKPKS